MKEIIIKNIEELQFIEKDIEKVVIDVEIEDDLLDLPDFIRELKCKKPMYGKIIIPQNCEKLNLFECYQEVHFPNSLQYLKINGKKYKHNLLLPPHLKIFKLKVRIIPDKIIFPSGLQELYFYYNVCEEGEFYRCKKLDIPTNITHLQLPFRYPYPLPNLPKLKYLSMGPECPEELQLPEGLEELYLHSSLKLNYGEMLFDETPKTKIMNIPSTLHTIQIPIKELYHSFLGADFNVLQNFHKEIEPYMFVLDYVPNIKKVYCNDELSIDELEDEDDEYYDQIKTYFKNNPQIDVGFYKSKYVKVKNGFGFYDDDDTEYFDSSDEEDEEEEEDEEKEEDEEDEEDEDDEEKEEEEELNELQNECNQLRI